MSDGSSAEEIQLFSEMKTDLESLEKLILGGEYQLAYKHLYHTNLNLEIIIDHYSLNHDCSNPSMVINLGHCLTIRNTMLYNVLWIIGPRIYPRESDVNWDSFTSTLPTSKECLREGYLHIREYIDEEALKRIVTISLRVGTIEDYEIAGIAYSLSYFLLFLIVEEVSGKNTDLVGYFYSHITDYSFVLLVTSVLSAQKDV